MDLIMHRVTKESGLTDSANGSMAKDTEPLGSTTKGGRHVGLDKMCLLMEVRKHGVLGNSAWGCGTLQRKEGDVVLLLPALPDEGVEFLHQEVHKGSFLSVLCDQTSKPRKAEHLTLGVVGLDQPIAIEQSVVAQGEHCLLLLVVRVRHEAEGHPSSPQLLSIPAAVVPQVGQIMAGVGVPQTTALWV